MISFLRILFIVVFLWMVYTVVSTSLESNLFEEWSSLAQIPWMKATLWDFYANTLIIALWAMYKERSAASRALWVVLFVVLGSIATSAYILMHLFRLSPGDGVDKLILRTSSS